MLSRVADAIYWMNRYIERAENYARFLDVNFNLSLELYPDMDEQWRPLVLTTGDWPLFEACYDDVNKTNVIRFLGFDDHNPNSIHSSVVQARENARAIRPEITTELWEQINHLYYFVKEGQEKRKYARNDPRKFFTEVKRSCQLLYGILDSTISKSEGWHFGKIGQMIERADKTSRVLDVKYHILLPTVESVGSPYDLVQWAALLKSVSAYDMYRKKYGKLTPKGISEFLIFDPEFPRSILSAVNCAEQSLQQITGTSDYRSASDAEKQLAKLKSHLMFSEIEDVFEAGMHEYINDIQIRLNEVSLKFNDAFFSTETALKQEQHINSNMQ